MQTHYRQERADEVRKAQDIWMPALLIEEDVAEHRAARPDGGLYHTPAECIVMAQMVSTEGHADPKYDISGKLPDRYVKHYIDALIYGFRALDEYSRAKMDREGGYEVAGDYGEGAPAYYSGDDSL